MDTQILVVALASLGGVLILSVAGLIGWRGWLELKMTEIEKRPDSATPTNNINTRIDLADLKERLRKLEAIAAGIDL